jgi:HlyD family secretion protein
VREGQAVRAGELLAQLDGQALAATRASAAAQVAQWRQRLEELRHGARREEIAQLEAQLAAAVARSDQAEKDYTRATQLLARGLIAQAQVDQQLQLRDSSAASMRSAQSALDLLRAGTRLRPAGSRGAAAPAGCAARSAHAARGCRWRD